MTDRMPDSRPLVTRRTMIAATFGAAGLVVARKFVIAQDSASSAPRAVDGLILRNERPLDAEATFQSLDPWRTDAERFFIRSHFGAPTQLPASWALTIDGDVRAPLTLSFDEIRKLPSETRAVTLECAGNGRGLFAFPVTSALQWQYGAVGNALFTGVPLGALLDRAGLSAGAQHIWTEGLDRAPTGTVPKFLRSIPRDVALGDAFVAFEMNGGPIPLLHGGPLRLIVPGWYGMASTKWLTHLHARATESDNFYMAKAYHYTPDRPVERLKVKSVIVTPLDGQRVAAGKMTVKGKAWSGAGTGGIRVVDVSTDGGRRWQPARLTNDGADQPYAWRSWEAEIDLTAPGPRTMMARATDSTGAVQPLTAESNAGGFGNNSIHTVRFDVARS